jgi:uncharacterized protein (TIGR02246 family)
MPTNHDPAWLEQLHETFVEALRSNDLAALGACYTENAVLLPPGQPMVAGREAVVSYWQKAERIQDLVFEATDTRALGTDALREAGNLLVTTRGQGRETFNVASKYISLWIKVDGVWKIDSTAWSRASGPGGGGRGRQGGGGGGGGGRRRQGGGGGPGGGGRRQGGGAGRQAGGNAARGGDDED